MTVQHRPRVEWTPRQREVLALIAEGLTNAQIGDRLGISLDGAKWHVSEILGRLGVDSREEAAAYWRSEQGLRPRIARGAAATFGAIGGRWLVAAAGFGSVAVITGAMAIILLARGAADSVPGADPEATPSTQILGTPTPAIACPLEQQLCDFAFEQEGYIQRGDVASLLDPSPWQRSGDTSSFATNLASTLPAGATPPYVASIGCPLSTQTRSESCEFGFALAISTYPGPADSAPTGLILFLYQRAANGDHELRATVSPEGPDRIYATDGVPGSLACFDFQATNVEKPCVQISWHKIDRTPKPPPGNDLVENVPAQELALGDPIALPANLRVFAGLATYAADSGVRGWMRVVRTSKGVRIDDLKANLNAAAGVPQQVGNSWAGDERMHRLAATVCRSGQCWNQGTPQPDGTIHVFESFDGGITWEDAGEANRSQVIAVTNQGVLMATYGVRDNDVSFVERYWYLESGQDVQPPLPGMVPSTIDGGLIWIAGKTTIEQVVDANGALLVQPAYQPPDSYQTFIGRALPSLNRWLTTWFVQKAGGGIYVAELGADNHVAAAWHWGETGDLRAEVPIAPDLVLGGATLPPAVAPGFEMVLIDLRNNRVRHINDIPAKQGSLFVDRAVTGPFFVVTGAGDCLNVRTEPSSTAPVLRCYRDDVLLDDRQQTSTEGGIGGREWRAVITPEGKEGWAAAEFLE